MKRTPGERTRHSPQDEKAQAMLRRRKFRKGTTNTTRKTRQKAKETRDNAPEEEDTAREKQNNFPNGAAILGGRSLEKGDHPGRILHNPSLEKRQRESCGTQDAKIINGLKGSVCRRLASAIYPVDELLSRKVKRTKNAAKRSAHYVIPDDSNPAGESNTRASIVGQAEDGVAKSIGNHADEDGDQRAEAEEQQTGQAALIRMEGQLRRGKAQQGQSIADMKDRERRRIVTLHNNSGSKEE
ncbi:hypothetical protein C8F01DRAFT_1085474 [Mycena amicta]|nr:hypothetical protein C8F01DRAFT_1085474 [Mycena amicta]